jgi:hypothetical protein
MIGQATAKSGADCCNGTPATGFPVLPARQNCAPGQFPGIYFLRGAASADGPGLSNKRFRSWLRCAGTI